MRIAIDDIPEEDEGGKVEIHNTNYTLSIQESPRSPDYLLVVVETYRDKMLFGINEDGAIIIQPGDKKKPAPSLAAKAGF